MRVVQDASPVVLAVHQVSEAEDAESSHQPVSTALFRDASLLGRWLSLGGGRNTEAEAADRDNLRTVCGKSTDDAATNG